MIAGPIVNLCKRQLILHELLQSPTKALQANDKRKRKKDAAASVKGNKDDIFGVGLSKSRR